MEQKLKDKLDKAIAIYRQKAEQFKAEFDAFIKEMLTDDIRSMIKSIVESTHRTYHYPLGGENIWIHYDRTYPEICAKENNETICYFSVSYPTQPYYNNGDIVRLAMLTDKLADKQKWFKLLQDNAKDIIADICKQYKDLTEAQSDKLDKILDMLDINDEPTRHIKVTVEWI